MNNLHYSDEKNILLMVALLKAHNIRRVIASPGTTNITFIGSLMHDPFFEMYSATISALACPRLSMASWTETLCGVVLSCFSLRIFLNSSMDGAAVVLDFIIVNDL